MGWNVMNQGFWLIEMEYSVFICNWMEWKFQLLLNGQERKISLWVNRKGNFNWTEVETSHQLNEMESFKENKREADISTSKEEKTKYFTFSGRERYIVRKMYSSQGLQDWEMCSYVLNETRKVVLLNVDKKQDWKIKSF